MEKALQFRERYEDRSAHWALKPCDGLFLPRCQGLSPHSLLSPEVALLGVNAPVQASRWALVPFRLKDPPHRGLSRGGITLTLQVSLRTTPLCGWAPRAIFKFDLSQIFFYNIPFLPFTALVTNGNENSCLFICFQSFCIPRT